MKKRTAKEEIRRSTKTQPPRVNRVFITGSVVGISLEVGNIELENGLEFQTAPSFIGSLGLEVGDLVLVRGELQTFAVDNIAGGIERTNYTYVRGPHEVGGGNNIRILKRAADRVIIRRPLQSILETVEIRDGLYEVEAKLNLETEEYEDYRITVGDVDMTLALQESYVKTATGSFVWIVDEILAEVSGRRGE